MNVDFMQYEDALFEYVKKIKSFNELLIKKYQLNDIPYNVSGKSFPKIGNITDEQNKTISYRFHGRGATFVEDNIEVYFSIDTTSKYQIIISVGGFYCFLTAYLEKLNEDFPLERIMEDFERRGIFIQRKISDLGTFHVNEIWYESKLKGYSFIGQNKYDIDWR